ncbi:MAG: hypothetical protein NTY88_02505 [Bacteroidetes bacterium]|nr:hypothetical protein [Bacteroidota bacterium]
MNTANSEKHVVAVFGGAVAGSELVKQLTAQGIHCVVFDQNILPHGKIEDGLPKWHSKQRDSEENHINERMNHPLVHFVPQCKLGRDIFFKEVMSWNFSAVVLATGAWKDRSLPVPEIDDYIGKGLYYQNPFVYWYNHKHEPAFTGTQFEIADNSIVIGGGLASLDVVKIIMIELVTAKLKERGMLVSLVEMNHGINKILAKHKLTLEELGIAGCTLYYRRRDEDMPLSHLAADTPEHIAKAKMTRQKILNNYQTKFLFRFEPCMAPVDKIVENGKLTGIIFRRTQADEKGCVEIAGSEVVIKSPVVISSIGSLPEHVEGISTSNSTFKIEDETSCRISGSANVFIVGNAVTGKGNIADSLHHAKQISAWMLQHFFPNQTPLTEEKISEIIRRATQLQVQKGYDGNYLNWAKLHTPIRLESMV